MQIRPWRLADADYVVETSIPLYGRRTVFVGGVPRPIKAGPHNFKSLVQGKNVKKKRNLFSVMDALHVVKESVVPDDM